MIPSPRESQNSLRPGPVVLMAGLRIELHLHNGGEYGLFDLICADLGLDPEREWDQLAEHLHRALIAVEPPGGGPEVDLVPRPHLSEWLARVDLGRVAPARRDRLRAYRATMGRYFGLGDAEQAGVAA